MANAPTTARIDSAEAKAWEPPTSDQEFVFKDIESAPAWVDRNWASYSMGPALAVPAGDIYGGPPYTTNVARVGDTVKFKMATPSRPAHMEVSAGEPTEDNATLKIPQVSAASLEDMLKTGVLTPDDLGPDAKAQVVARSPSLTQLVEEGKAAPKAIPVEDLVKVA